MTDFFNALRGIFSSPFCVPVFAMFIPLVAIIATFWYKTVKDKSDNQLKQSMLERGMSAEDIERVINAGSEKDKKKK